MHVYMYICIYVPASSGNCKCEQMMPILVASWQYKVVCFRSCKFFIFRLSSFPWSRNTQRRPSCSCLRMVPNCPFQCTDFARSLRMCIYTYIYTHTHTHPYRYMYSNGSKLPIPMRRLRKVPEGRSIYICIYTQIYIYTYI